MIRRVHPRMLLCGVALAAGLLATPAPAQEESREDIAMQNQILELRHDLDALRDQVGQGGASQAPPPSAPSGSGAPVAGDAVAGLLDRVSQLEDQVRTLQGRIDEGDNKLQQQNADLTKQLGDMNFRVQTLEAKAGIGPPVAPPPVPGGPLPAQSLTRPTVPIPPPVAPAGRVTLQQGYAALARRDYAMAEAGARQTLATPKSPRANDAQFLLAQSLAGQHSYQQAALAYDDAYTKARKGPHAQDALIGLASSLTAIGAKPAACATLDKLHAEFPAARPDVRASSSAIYHRANCR